MTSVLLHDDVERRDLREVIEDRHGRRSEYLDRVVRSPSISRRRHVSDSDILSGTTHDAVIQWDVDPIGLSRIIPLMPKNTSMQRILGSEPGTKRVGNDL